MEESELQKLANDISISYGLKAEILSGIHSVGVGGDMRTYTPIINLIGEFVGHEILGKVSSLITSVLPINRVTFQLGKNI